MKIKIKYHNGVDNVQKIKIGDWIDLRAAEDIFVPEGQIKMISLGVSMELPKGYEAHVVPRSSTFKNFGIIMVNSMGIIDNSYCGDNDIWHFPAYCLKETYPGGTQIHKNDRICQFRIVKTQPRFRLVEYITLGNKNRGGFGSTGVK